MKKMTMWGLVAVMAVIGFASSPAQAKEPGFKQLEEKALVEGRRGYRPSRRGGYYPRRGGYYRGGRRHYGGWGGGFYYSSGPRYYAPAPVVVVPAPTVVYGGGCY